MKEGWEYKKLGEVAEIIGGSTPKTDNVDYWNGSHYWVTPAELDGSKYIYSTERTITDKAIQRTNLTMLPEGTVLLSSRAPIGKVCITKSPMYCNQGFKNLICGSSLVNEYVYYWLKSNTAYLQSLGTGATFKEISKRVVESIVIPMPPISKQKSIAEELDVLSGIIEKEKAQLEELDKLAQSIFYDMFGDPVTNDKGWKLKKVIDVVKLQRGYDLPVQKRNSNGNIPIYGANGIVGYHSEAKVDFGIITGRSGSIGEVYLCQTPFWPLNTSLFSVDTHNNNIIFLKFLIKNFDLKRFKMGAGVPTLNRNSFHQNNIIDIPIFLQQEFADKISAIESMKAKVRQSLKEAEQLFNSRMDYYFN